MTATEPLFQQDAYLRTCTATVIEAGEGGLVLDRTVFYPLGGGQPGDTGWLRASDGRAWRVADTRKGEGGRIVHVRASAATEPAPGSASAGIPIDLPAPGTALEAEIDWDRRHAHMRMHTCLGRRR